MEKKRVLLLCSEHLLGESLVNLLRALEEVILVGSLALDNQVIQRIARHQPDVVLIGVEADQEAELFALTARIMDRFPDLPVIYSSLTRNAIRVYTSREVPAQTADLLDLLHEIPALKWSDP
jgi:chemotaxis response regulator CheB